MRHVQLLWMLLVRSWGWQTTLDCEMPSSPDTLSVLLTGFAKVMKLTNHTGLWDTGYTRFFPSASHCICCNVFEHVLEIHDFRLYWPCLIIDVLESWAKFLEPSGYGIVINCRFTLCLANVSGWYCCVMAVFQLVKYLLSKFLRRSLLIIINGFWTIVFILLFPQHFGRYVLRPSSDVHYLNFWDEPWWFLSLRVFGLLSSSLLLFPQRFGQCPPAIFRCLSNLGTNTELRTTSFI